MTNSSGIGLFDSGIGGLSIARKVRELLPSENILYVADSLHAPYGDKADSFLLARMRAITEFLVSHGAKVVVVACNTATTSAIAELRSQYSVPIIGVEPGIKPAALRSRTGVIGVLATPRTLETNAFFSLAERYASGVKIEVQSCPDLAAQIESLSFDSDRTIALLKRYISPLLEKRVDTIILGCTHYNHVSHLIAELAGPDVAIVNTATAVANEVVRRLTTEGLLAVNNGVGSDDFWTNGALDVYRNQIEQLWGQGKNIFQL
ncbi:glutamate racemase [Porticoccus sp.]|uniref:glutamate racemase n=1 Tax=Porticoccus sp. TaxID=2024853 RepID=UPI003F69BD26